jgi:protein subunit release factor A
MTRWSDLVAKLEAAQMRTLLSDPEDMSEAILEIHPGAGGTESQDWAEMLLRMYRRFADRGVSRSNSWICFLATKPGSRA